MDKDYTDRPARLTFEAHGCVHSIEWPDSVIECEDLVLAFAKLAELATFHSDSIKDGMMAYALYLEESHDNTPVHNLPEGDPGGGWVFTEDDWNEKLERFDDALEDITNTFSGKDFNG